MCGIAGVLTPRAKAGGLGRLREQAEAMAACLAHRGPDAQDVAELALGENELVLAHRRLAIIDLSPEGEQPMRLPEAGLTIVFNGELYNYRDVRADLASRGETFATATDTEVLLRAWARWGADALDRFEGMWAFALADERSGTLTLARDPFGIKPLYVHEGAEGLTFASEIRALLKSGRVPREIAPEAIPSYLDSGSIRAPGTLVRDVRSIDPGAYETWDSDGRHDFRCYWSLTERVLDREPATAEEVHELVRRAIRLETVSDVPLGAFLSGGVDSSAIVGVLADGGQRPITVSLVFDEARYSEAEHSRAVAAHYGTDHREILVRAAEVADLLPTIARAQDSPSIDGVNVWLVSRAARQAGLTVALSGLGGDEIFAGYDVFRNALRWQSARTKVPRLPAALGRGLARMARPLGPRRAKMAEALLATDDIGAFQSLSRRLFAPPEVCALAGIAATPRPVPGGLDRLDPLARVSVLETGRYMHDTLLRDADAMSMAHSLEVRVPLINPRLAVAAVSAPASIKLGAGPKPLLTGAIPNPIPASAVDRTKGTFTLPFDAWMRGPLRDLVRSASEGAPGLDPTAVRSIWERFDRGEPGLDWSRIWAIADLSLWARENRVA